MIEVNPNLAQIIAFVRIVIGVSDVKFEIPATQFEIVWRDSLAAFFRHFINVSIDDKLREVCDVLGYEPETVIEFANCNSSSISPIAIIKIVQEVAGWKGEDVIHRRMGFYNINPVQFANLCNLMKKSFAPPVHPRVV